MYEDKPPIEEVLEHHGIKGQKWGVRRFQNKDGSYTSAGKKRYASSNEDESAKKAKLRRNILIGASVAAAAIAAYGGYRYAKAIRDENAKLAIEEGERYATKCLIEESKSGHRLSSDELDALAKTKADSYRDVSFAEARKHVVEAREKEAEHAKALKRQEQLAKEKEAENVRYRIENVQKAKKAIKDLTSRRSDGFSKMGAMMDLQFIRQMAPDVLSELGIELKSGKVYKDGQEVT